MVGSKAGFELRWGARWDPHVPWAGQQMEPAHWGFFLCHPHLHLLCLWMFSLSGRGLEAEIYSSSLHFHLPCQLNFFHGLSSPSYELQSPEELVPDFQIYQGLGNRLCKWPSDEHATVSMPPLSLPDVSAQALCVTILIISLGCVLVTWQFCQQLLFWGTDVIWNTFRFKIIMSSKWII